MIGGRRPLSGRKVGDRRVRVERPHSAYFRYSGPGQLTAKAAASAPTTAVGRGWARAKRIAIGRPLASEEEIGGGRPAVRDRSRRAPPGHLGRTLREIDLQGRFRLTPIALIRGGKVIVNPPRDEVLRAGDELVLVGGDEGFVRFGE
jgi:hypothetical protein